MMLDKSRTNVEEVTRIWLEYQQVRRPDLRDRLIGLYLPLVKVVAGQIAIGLPQYVDKDDLISNGFFGLLDAIDRYDPHRGAKFETYAVTRIRGAILDSLRAQDWIPASLRQKARHYEQAVSRLETALGRSAADDEIAASLGMSVNQLHTLLSQLNATTIVPLDEYIRTESGPTQPINPSHAVEEVEVKQTLAGAIDNLPEKERLVVSLYYYENLTLKEISLVMKLSEARISQLHTKAVFRMRAALSRLRTSLL